MTYDKFHFTIEEMLAVKALIKTSHKRENWEEGERFYLVYTYRFLNYEPEI